MKIERCVYMLKKERFNIMLNPRIVCAIDNYSKAIDSSRSELINNILSDYITENDLFHYIPKEPELVGQLKVV